MSELPAHEIQGGDVPMHIGIIGGSGLAEQLLASDRGLVEGVEDCWVETPFGKPSGVIQTGSVGGGGKGGEGGGLKVSLMARHGAGHVLNPSAVPYRANIYALKALGVTHLIASGAAGSLREELTPGSVVLVDQFIDKTVGRARTFYEQAAVHVEFAEPCCGVMRRWLREAAGRCSGFECHDGGTYVCMEGPAFSTRAESELHRSWGGDLIGMTAMPEAKLAREAEIAYALVGLPTDYDAWRPASLDKSQDSLLAEIIGNLNRASVACIELIRKALEDVSVLSQEHSAAHDALGLAIWSEKSNIETSEIQKLDVIWGRYFRG